MLCVGEGLEDRVEQELAEIVDGIGDEGGDAEIVGARLGVFEGERFEVDAGEVEESVFVVGAEVGFGLEVAGVCTVEGGVDFRLDRVEVIED